MNPTQVAYLDTRRPLQDGTFPVKIKVTHRRDRRYYRTGINLTPEDWNRIWSVNVKGKLREAKNQIEACSERAKTILDELPTFSFALFEKAYFSKEESQTNDIFASTEAYIKQLHSEERTATAISYQCALNSFRKFYPHKELRFDAVTPEFLKQYERWMLIQEGNSVSSVGIYLRSIRAIFNKALTNNIIKPDQYPFGKKRYTIPAGKNIKKALNKEELKQVFEYQPIEGTWEDKAKDFWIFSYLCNGMNIKDILLLRFNNIDGDTLTYIRSKTARTKREVRPIEVFLRPEAIAIIKKWGKPKGLPNDYIFSELNDSLSPKKAYDAKHQFTKQVNKYMNRIGQAIGLTKPMNSYAARHSFSTMLKRSGVSVEYISESLGHRDIRTTDDYLDSFESETKRQFSDKLVDFG